MKIKELIELYQGGILLISTHCLTATDSYKVVRFRKELRGIIEKVQTDERELMTEAGIADPEEFDRRRLELQKARVLTVEAGEELSRLDKMFGRFAEMREALKREEVEIFSPRLDYDTWKKLQDENNTKDRDILSGPAEDILEGVLWVAPEL